MIKVLKHMRHILILGVLLFTLLSTQHLYGQTLSSSPDALVSDPIEVLEEGDNYFLKVDLHDNRVQIRVGLANNDTGGYETLASMQNRYVGQGYDEWIVINGDYFSPGVCPSNRNCAQGLTYIDGIQKDNWSEYLEDNRPTWLVRSSIGFDPSKGIQIEIGNRQTKQYMTLGGGPWIVRNGEPPICDPEPTADGRTRFSTGEEFAGPDALHYCTRRDELTIAGYSEDGRYLYIGVSESGENLFELAQWLKDRGAYNILKLDGGGSSGIYHNGELRRGDDTREIANSLAVVVNPSHSKPINLWFPWYYLISTGDSRVTNVLLDGKVLFEKPACARVLWIGGGQHTLTTWYEASSGGVPTIDLKPWPFVSPACAAESSEPPPSTNNPNESASLLLGAQFTGIEYPSDNYTTSPGTTVHKTWQMKNTGNSTWDAGYKLVFRGGNQMGEQNEVSVPVTLREKTAELAIDITVPSEPGKHRGYWQLRNPDQTFFGDIIWVEIEVSKVGGGDPPPDDGRPTIELECLDCPTTVAPGKNFRPTIGATVNSGNLQGIDLRGDMLRHKSGERYGAYEFVAIPGSTVIPKDGHYDFTFYEDNPITAPNEPGTYESVWQVWRNGGWDGEEFILRFEVKDGSGTNRAPSRPTLTGPGDWAVYTGNGGITLNAKDNGDPDGDAIYEYYFEIFESAQNANSGWSTNNSWSPQGLGFNGYQWRVKVRDSRGAESDWSNEVWHFTIQTNEPQIYEFGTSACRPSWGNADQICFCARTNAGTLQLQINTATDGSDTGEWRVINELGVPDYRCEDDANRPPNWNQLEGETGRHLVRLYARRDGGWEAAAHSDIYLDLPAERRPNTVPSRLPLHNTYLNSRTVRFSWEDSLRTTEYQFELALNPNEAARLVDIRLPYGTTEYVHTFGEDHPEVFWRVTSHGPHGYNQSGWNRLYIDRTPPTSMITSLPEVTTETKFTVQWSGSDTQSGLNWYHIQVRDGNRADSEWQDWLVNTTKISEMFNGLAGHTYYFRVRAMDVIGNWEAWPAGDGDTVTLVDPAAAPLTPWWSDAYTWRSNLLILNNDSDQLPIGFPVHIHFNEGTTPTAAEIYNASQAGVKGNDVRVVYNNQTELDRIVDNFTPTVIDIFFAVQNVIPGENSDGSSYQLYVGNPQADNPPMERNNVYLPRADANTMGLWRFQEGVGSNAWDASGRGHNGVFNSPGWSYGLIGWAGEFNGSSSYVEIPHSEDFHPGAITMEAWVYLTGSTGNYPMIFNKDRYWFRITGDRNLQFSIGADGGDRTITGQTQLNLGQWYHVAATYDGNLRMRIYLNGQLDQEGNNGAPPTLWNSEPLRIGRAERTVNVYFPGYIQHARYSNIERPSFAYGRVDVLPTIGASALTVPPIPGTADLALVSLQAYPDDTGGWIVAAIVQNQGDANTRNGFYTDLYVDHLPTGSGDYTGSLQFWVNSPIEPGAVVTLTTKLQDVAVTAEVSTEATNSDKVSIAAATAIVAEQSATLYAQVDTAGLVREQDKANNIYATGVTVCTASQDALEPDDTVAQAKQLKLDQGYNHNLHVAGDNDWGKFSATGGTTYAIRTDTLGAAADTYLYLYDTNKTTLLMSNDDTAVSLASEIIWKAPTDGIYYVLVKHWNAQVEGCGTTYRLVISEADTKPNAPQLDAPGNAQTVNTKTPTLTWLGVVSASSYHLQLANNAEFTDPIIDAEVNTTSYTTQELADGAYYWRVRSRAGTDNWSDWSSVRNFSVSEDEQDDPVERVYVPRVAR